VVQASLALVRTLGKDARRIFTPVNLVSSPYIGADREPSGFGGIDP
jgi:hypothetical protein